MQLTPTKTRPAARRSIRSERDSHRIWPRRVVRFQDGTAQGWTASNSKAAVSEERHGDSKFSLKVEPGQWGANPSRDKLDLSHCKTLKFQLYAVPDKEGGLASPFLYINGTNTNKQIGPEKNGHFAGGKWVDWTVELSEVSGRHHAANLWREGASISGQECGTAKPIGKKKPDSSPNGTTGGEK